MSNIKLILIRILVPTLYFLVFFTAYFYLGSIIEQFESLHSLLMTLSYVTGILIWFSFAWILIRLADLVIWQLIFEQHLGVKIPSLLRQLLRAFIFFIAILGIVGVLFQKSISALITASGLVGVVVGFSIKNLIADLFNGLALSLDKPFKIGDMVFFHDMVLKEIMRVKEISWRTTRFETLAGTMLIISNRQVCSMAITNYSKNRYCYDFLIIYLDPSIPTQRAITLLEAATISTPFVYCDEQRQVSVQARGWDEHGLHYRINYNFDTDKIDLLQIRTNVMTSVTEHLQQSGFSMAIPKMHQIQSAFEEDNYQEAFNPEVLIRKIPIFKDLNEAELNLLLADISEQRYLAGDLLVEEGQSGDSMFVLAEGLLKVQGHSNRRKGRKVKKKLDEPALFLAYINPGDYFGEMSLLTGEPRSATVIAELDSLVFCIPKQSMQVLFETRPECMQSIAELLADRQETNKAQFAAAAEASEEIQESDSLVTLLMKKIKLFFGFTQIGQ